MVKYKCGPPDPKLNWGWRITILSPPQNFCSGVLQKSLMFLPLSHFRVEKEVHDFRGPLWSTKWMYNVITIYKKILQTYWPLLTNLKRWSIINFILKKPVYFRIHDIDNSKVEWFTLDHGLNRPQKYYNLFPIWHTLLAHLLRLPKIIPVCTRNHLLSRGEAPTK